MGETVAYLLLMFWPSMPGFKPNDGSCLKGEPLPGLTVVREGLGGDLDWRIVADELDLIVSFLSRSAMTCGYLKERSLTSISSLSFDLGVPAFGSIFDCRFFKDGRAAVRLLFSNSNMK